MERRARLGFRVGLMAVALSVAPGCGTPTRAGASPGAVPTAPTANGDPLPDTWVAPLDGELTSLRGLVKGRVAVIDLWATWCTACRPVTERMGKLRAAFDPKDVAVLGIDQGEETSLVARHQAATPAPYDVYVDPTLALSDALGVKHLPTVIVVDRAGRVRRIDHGVGPEVVSLVDALLREPPAPADRN